MKEVKHAVMLKLPARKATPAPPIGPILGPSNIDVVKFCDDFNAWSKDLESDVEFGILIYDDLSYDILSKEEFNQYKSSQLNESLSFMYGNSEGKSLRR